MCHDAANENVATIDLAYIVFVFGKADKATMQCALLHIIVKTLSKELIKLSKCKLATVIKIKR